MIKMSGNRSWLRKIGIGLLAAVGALGLLYGALRLADAIELERETWRNAS